MTSGSTEKDQGWNNALETAAQIAEAHAKAMDRGIGGDAYFRGWAKGAREIAAEIRDKKTSGKEAQNSKP